MTRIFLLPIVAFTLLCARWANAELILSAPPRESAEQGERVFGPLADELSKVMGEKVTYVHPNNWASYSNGQWNDKYDFVFDGPHFVAWRMANKGHQVLARLAGTLSFYVVARDENGAPQKLEDLKMQPVCAIPSPNMMASVLLSQFGPVDAPNVVGIKGGLKNVYKSLLEKKCVAGVFRYEFIDKLKEEDRKKLKILFRSRIYPNQALTVSTRVDPSKRQAIIDALTKSDAPYTAPIRKRFGTPGMNGSFIPVKPGEFEGHNKLLEGVVWGW